MSFVSRCPYCNNAFEAEEQYIGRIGACPSCGRHIVIQHSDESASRTPGESYGHGYSAPPPQTGYKDPGDHPRRPTDRDADLRNNGSTIGGKIRGTFQLDRLEGFSVSRFLRQVFKHHSWDEVTEYMTIGTPHNTPPLNDVQPIWPAPWLFLRTMLSTVLLYLFLIWRQDLFGIYALLPLWIVGVIGIPFAALLFFWEVNITKNISILSLLRIVIVSGFASIALTFLIGEIVGNPKHPVWAGPIEETAKALIMLYFVRNPKYRFKLNGLLIGAAVGAGFAIIESGGYMLRNGNDGTMELRALCAPFGHVAYSAIVGFAMWRAKRLPRSFSSNLMSSAFLPLFALAIGLHMFWNGLLENELIIRTAIVGAVEYFVIIHLIQEGINEVRKIKEQSGEFAV